VAYGDMEEMKKQLRAHRLVEVRVLGELAPLQDYLSRTPEVASILAAPEVDLPAGTLRFDFTGDDAGLSALLGRLVAAEIPIVGFSEVTGDLEDVFLQATQGIVS
jgi:hypothetical protein